MPVERAYVGDNVAVRKANRMRRRFGVDRVEDVAAQRLLSRITVQDEETRIDGSAEMQQCVNLVDAGHAKRVFLLPDVQQNLACYPRLAEHSDGPVFALEP